MNTQMKTQRGMVQAIGFFLGFIGDLEDWEDEAIVLAYGFAMDINMQLRTELQDRGIYPKVN